ncbi:MAG: PAS domain S-box protein [Ignavibacteria bacterium]
MSVKPENRKKRNEDVLEIADCEVAECKKTKELLDRKQRELDCILDSSPTIIFYKDKEGRVIQTNRAFAKALRKPKEQLIGKTVFDLYSAEIAQAMTNDDLEVMKSKRPKVDIIEPYESPTGLRWILTSKIPSLDENGDVTGLIGFSEDITERKEAEEALKESEEKYRQLVDRLPNMVFEIDQYGRVMFANLRASELLGYSKAEFEDNFDANRLVAPEDVERSKENMQLMFKRGKRQSNEYSFVRKDGSRFPVLLTSAAIVKNKKVVGARGIAVDLTERKEMEKRLSERERLATIGATAGMVGHDIRNPLQAIVGDTFLLRLDLETLNDNKSKECMLESLNSIDKNVGYINKIVQDLQDYAKPITLAFEETNFESVILDVLCKKAIPANVDASYVIQEAASRIVTDPSLLKRILANLVNNAVQAMPDGGKLVIQTYKKAKNIAITVEDTGRGIPDEIKPKLFTPLFTTKSKGQGFGLAVVKRMTDALGGSVSFESEKDKGTKFVIELPFNR